MVKVLVVEDNYDLLQSISIELQLQDYEVLTSENGLDAFQLLTDASSLPDIIVSDISMPQMDGFQLLEKVRATPAWKSIPFIFLTAHAQDENRLKSIISGVDHFLPKPFGLDQLVAIIENKLRRVQDIREDAERRLDKTKTDLLAILSHELRTPVTSIYTGMEFIYEDLETYANASSMQALKIVYDSAKRMKRLVHQVMFLGYIDSGKLTTEIQEHAILCNIPQILQEAVKHLQYDFPNRVDDIQMSLPQTPLHVKGISEALSNAFSEVILNALLFSFPQTPIQISLHDNNNHLEVVCQDQGYGISTNEIPQIWGRFVRGQHSKFNIPGVGLGLSLVQEAINLHDGQCHIESQEGQGTICTIILPKAKES